MLWLHLRARSLFFRIALHIIKHFELDTRRIHNDTTVTFQGQYKTSKSRPQITYGVNKDHRPDDTIHRNNVERLREILGRDDFIYVADSKLCTRKNLEHISGYGGKFVTVLPRTRVEDKNFRKTLKSFLSYLKEDQQEHPLLRECWKCSAMSVGTNSKGEMKQLLFPLSLQNYKNNPFDFWKWTFQPTDDII